MTKLYTKPQLLKKYAGKYIDVYAQHYSQRDKSGRWMTVYEVRKVSRTICENCNLPEDCNLQ
jgi:hypothetical protein